MSDLNPIERLAVEQAVYNAIGAEKVAAALGNALPATIAGLLGGGA